MGVPVNTDAPQAKNRVLYTRVCVRGQASRRHLVLYVVKSEIKFISRKGPWTLIVSYHIGGRYIIFGNCCTSKESNRREGGRCEMCESSEQDFHLIQGDPGPGTEKTIYLMTSSASLPCY